jgi:hypothetical protein
VVTVTLTVPADPAADVAVIEVAELTVKEVAATVPNMTAETEENPVPVTVTDVPPEMGQELGLTAVTVGAATKVNWLPDPVADTPPGAVTVTLTVPADSVGDVAVIEVSELTVMAVAAVVPNMTAVAPVKPVPVIMTGVPPAVGPTPGLRAVTVGAAK